jgi:hypothetical protein
MLWQNKLKCWFLEISLLFKGKAGQAMTKSLTLANALAYSFGGSSMMKKSFMAQENQYCQQSF